MTALKRFALAVALLTMVVACEGVTPLMSAARDGDVSRTNRLIANGADVDETSKYGWTAMMFAANAGHDDVVEVLLKAGADPNIESQRISGNTQAPYPKSNALREAIDNGHLGLAKTLLNSGALPDPTAFAMAGGTNDLALLRMMRDMGADPNTPSAGPDAYHPSALCVASIEGKLLAVQWLIEEGVDPNLVALGCNPLWAAVSRDRLDVAKLLLQHGADPNFQSRPGKVTPLLRCVRLHTQSAHYDPKFEMLRLLLDANTDRTYTTDAWPYENRSALDFVRHERDRAAERVELPGFEYDWPGGIGQLVEKHNFVMELLDSQK